MARETIKEVKRMHQKEVSSLKLKAWLKCAECQGYFIDGYNPCPNKKCPLRGLFPHQRTVESLAFKKEMKTLAQEQKNDPEFTDKILSPKKERAKKSNRLRSKAKKTKKGKAQTKRGSASGTKGK